MPWARQSRKTSWIGTNHSQCRSEPPLRSTFSLNHTATIPDIDTVAVQSMSYRCVPTTNDASTADFGGIRSGRSTLQVWVSLCAYSWVEERLASMEVVSLTLAT